MRMKWAAEKVRGIKDLHYLATMHDRNTIADICHYTQVVGNKQAGQIEFFLQLQQQIDYLSLNRHVESGKRFVRDYNFGFEREGARKDDALALPAAELVRKSVHVHRI